MTGRKQEQVWRASGLILAALLWAARPTAAGLIFGPEQLIQASGADILVPGYSVPSFVHWDDDGLRDLVVGEGAGFGDAKVRVYRNIGATSAPQFAGFVYAQASGGDLAVPASGCLGAFPRVVYWDADGRKDMVVGQADGTVKLFRNTGTDASPAFDAGTLLVVGPPGSKTPIDVGLRATPAVADWNNDGRKDLVVGALDGKLHVFLNEGTDAEPDFRGEALAQDNGSDLVVPTARSSPAVADLDGDGRKDVLSGNTEGQLVVYGNVGSDAAPAFAGYSLIESGGSPVDLPGTPRSRPFVCDWTEDGVLDLLVGAGDGRVRLYEGIAAAEPPVAALKVEVLTSGGAVALAGGERVNTGSAMRFTDSSTGTPPPGVTLTLNGIDLPPGLHEVDAAGGSFLLGENLARLQAENPLGEDEAELRFEVIAAPQAVLVLRVNGAAVPLAGLVALEPGDAVELDGRGSGGTVERWAFRRGGVELASGSSLGQALYAFTAGQEHGGAFALEFLVENGGLGNARDALTGEFVVVPEPATLALVGAGVLWLAGLRSREARRPRSSARR